MSSKKKPVKFYKISTLVWIFFKNRNFSYNKDTCQRIIRALTEHLHKIRNAIILMYCKNYTRLLKYLFEGS